MVAEGSGVRQHIAMSWQDKGEGSAWLFAERSGRKAGRSMVGDVGRQQPRKTSA